MDQYQFEISPEQVLPIDKLEIQDDLTYLYVFHADKVPPHLGIVANGMFFSLKANGIDLDLSVSKINALIERKKICTLIYEINKGIIKDVREVFLAHGKYINTGETCLNPISEVYYTNQHHAKIGELLSDLKQEKCILNIYGAYLSSDFKGILNYSIEEINDRIKKLQE